MRKVSCCKAGRDQIADQLSTYWSARVIICRLELKAPGLLAEPIQEGSTAGEKV